MSERIILVKFERMWQATVRDGPFHTVGWFKPTEAEAIADAREKFAAEHPWPKTKSTTDLRDLLE